MIKKHLSILLCILLLVSVFPVTVYGEDSRAGVSVDEQNFPDAVFRDYISENFDSNGDGVLSSAEIAQVKNIDLNAKGVSSLRGVEHLTALETLNCSNNPLTEIVFPNSATFKALTCYACQLPSLDVSDCPALEYLECGLNKLETLDVSGNTHLEYLGCNYNQLDTLNVSGASALKTIRCKENQLKALDLSGNHQLESLVCTNNLIEELDVSGKAAMSDIWCASNQLRELDLSGSNALTAVDCSHNQLQSLDASGKPNLYQLWCFDNQLTSLNVTDDAALRFFECHANSLEQLDISTCPQMVGVYRNGEMSESDDKYIYAFYNKDGWEVTCIYIDKFTEIVIPDHDRVAGSNRFMTGIGAAEWLKNNTATLLFPNIVIASGTDFPDALAGAYLAVVKEAPVLLTNAGFAPTLAEYVSANLAYGGTVYILGGKGAVPEVMETELQKKGITNIKRLSGSNRYATNLAILMEAGVEGQDLLICSGNGYADSLPASALGKPILLVGKSLTDDQKSYLAEIQGDLSGNIYALGGKGAVPEDVFSSVKVYATGETERVAGKDRFKTSVAIAEKFMPETVENAVLAYAMNYPDGLAGGPVAYVSGSPLLLVTNSIYDDAKAYCSQSGINSVIVIGGESLIPDILAQDISQ